MFLSRICGPAINDFNRYINCWHHEDVEHNKECVTTIYKIDVRLYIGPEPTQDGKYRSGSLQPEYVTHTYSFKKDPGEQEPEYVCFIVELALY